MIRKIVVCFAISCLSLRGLSAQPSQDLSQQLYVCSELHSLESLFSFRMSSIALAEVIRAGNSGLVSSESLEPAFEFAGAMAKNVSGEWLECVSPSFKDAYGTYYLEYFTQVKKAISGNDSDALRAARALFEEWSSVLSDVDPTGVLIAFRFEYAK